MKRFFKRLGYGLEKFLISVWVLSLFVRAVLFCLEIPNNSGWFGVLLFCVSVLATFMGIAIIWSIGTEIDEYKQLKNDKENKDNPELLKGGIDNGFFNNL